jgi:hypothetical protein
MSFSFLKQAHGVKGAIKEAGEGGGAAAPPAEPKEEEPTPPAEPEEVPPPPPAKPEEVPPPPPEEVKSLKPPRREVVWPFLRAPKVDYSDVWFSVKMLYEAWQRLGKLAVHLGVQIPTGPKDMTVMDYAFKVNVLAGKLEREVPPLVYYNDDDDGSLDVSSSGSDSSPLVGLLRRRLPLLN